jgi:uncharacterized protein (DUF58 family)
MIQRALYHTFRVLSAADYWVRRRFTKPGLLVLGSLIGSAVVGIDTNQTVAYQAFTFLLAAVLLALAAAPFFRGRFVVRRVLPRFATAGEPVAYRVVVRNGTAHPRPGLAVVDDLTDPRPSLEEFLSAGPEDDTADNRWDRFVGYARWQSLIARNRGAVIEEQPLPTLPPGGETEVRVELVPQWRGHLRFTGVTVARPDPLGLFRAVHSTPLPESLLVLPRRYPVPPIRLPGTRKFQHGGVALASSVGDSEEFVSLRDYRPGDPPRRIHWRSWARVGHPVVREYQDEFFVRQALVLDTFTPERHGPRFEAAVSVAASLACALDTAEALLDLLFVGPRAYQITAGRGLAHLDQLLEVLAGVRACGDQPFAALHRLVMARVGALSGCLCVLLAWDDARQVLVRDLAAAGVPTIALVVTTPGESLGAGAADELVRIHRVEVGRVGEDLALL